MRKTIVIRLAIAVAFALAVAASRTLAADTFVFSKNGKDIDFGPRELPSVGVRLDTHKPVLGLHGAGDMERAACGWYRFVPNTNAIPAGLTIGSRTCSIAGWLAFEDVTYAPAPNPAAQPFEISKYKLLLELKGIGALKEFSAFLNLDPERKLFWDAASALDSTDPIVVSAADTLRTNCGIGAAAVSNLLWRCRAND